MYKLPSKELIMKFFDPFKKDSSVLPIEYLVSAFFCSSMSKAALTLLEPRLISSKEDNPQYHQLINQILTALYPGYRLLLNQRLCCILTKIDPQFENSIREFLLDPATLINILEHYKSQANSLSLPKADLPKLPINASLICSTQWLRLSFQPTPENGATIVENAIVELQQLSSSVKKALPTTVMQKICLINRNLLNAEDPENEHPPCHQIFFYYTTLVDSKRENRNLSCNRQPFTGTTEQEQLPSPVSSSYEHCPRANLTALIQFFNRHQINNPHLIEYLLNYANQSGMLLAGQAFTIYCVNLQHQKLKAYAWSVANTDKFDITADPHNPNAILVTIVFTMKQTGIAMVETLYPTITLSYRLVNPVNDQIVCDNAAYEITGFPPFNTNLKDDFENYLAHINLKSDLTRYLADKANI